MRLDRVLRSIAVLCAAAALSACANLKAVRDFSATSAQLTGYTEVTHRYLSSPARMQREVPPDPIFQPDREGLEKLAPAVAAERDSVLKLHNVVTGYMAALARLAGEDTFNISPQIDEVTGALVAAPHLGLNAEHVQAFGDIASKVSSWLLAAKQAKEVKAMVKAHGASMDTLLGAMEVVADAMRVQMLNEQGKVNSYLAYYESAFQRDVGNERPALAALTGEALQRYNDDRPLVQRRRQVAFQQVRREHQALRTEEQDAVSAATDALEGIRGVRRGHAEMMKNVDRLSADDVVALLQKAADDLKAVRDNLKKL